jgi:hypothetical protein
MVGSLHDERRQRIEYEILDCVLHNARHSEGYATTLPAFLERLQQLFPDLQTAEFVSITKWLFRQKLLGLRKSAGVFFRAYRGEHDDHEVKQEAKGRRISLFVLCCRSRRRSP